MQSGQMSPKGAQSTIVRCEPQLCLQPRDCVRLVLTGERAYERGKQLVPEADVDVPCSVSERDINVNYVVDGVAEV